MRHVASYKKKLNRHFPNKVCISGKVANCKCVLLVGWWLVGCLLGALFGWIDSCRLVYYKYLSSYIMSITMRKSVSTIIAICVTEMPCHHVYWESRLTWQRLDSYSFITMLNSYRQPGKLVFAIHIYINMPFYDLYKILEWSNDSYSIISVT